MIGRIEERRRLTGLLKTSKSEFLAVTGRRRVGKTFLIDEMYNAHYCFTMIGSQNGNMQTQLTLFSIQLARFDGSGERQHFTTWLEAFFALEQYLDTLDAGTKQVVFLDELPWIATPRSQFLNFLGHFWNNYLSKKKHFVLVICGSATSWIVNKVLADVGGLHNRITKRVHLYPFTLHETKLFFEEKRIKFDLNELAKVYMILGGIPYYLDQFQRGDSVAIGVERNCFSPTGELRNEYRNLYRALFMNSDRHVAVVKALAGKPGGLNRKELLKEVPDLSTGTFKKVLEELEVSNFVRRDVPFQRRKRGTLYRLIDEYSIFYYRFIEPMRKYAPGIWVQQSQGQAYRIWSGFAFENLCHKHLPAIKKALGIQAVYTEAYSVRLPTTNTNGGVQIDLLIDRNDNVINLCEIKFHTAPFVINEGIANDLKQKQYALLATMKKNKQILVTMITNLPLAKSAYADSVVDVAITLEDIAG